MITQTREPPSRPPQVAHRLNQELLGPYWATEERSVEYWQPARQKPSTPSITDGIADLLDLLDTRKRRGMIAWLAVGYYDGWRPGRQEVADLVAIELGLLTIDDYIQRKHQRRVATATVTDLTPLITQRARQIRY